MSLPRSVAEVLKQHVTLEVEGIDRMYLNVYQPRLQTDRGVAAFFRFHRGATFASSALMNPMSKSFIAAVDRFVKQEQIPLITFTKGQRKDDVTQEYRVGVHRCSSSCFAEVVAREHGHHWTTIGVSGYGPWLISTSRSLIRCSRRGCRRHQRTYFRTSRS